MDFCAETDLVDIAQFLEASRPETKMSALGIIHGLAGSPEGIECLKGLLDVLLPTLLRLVADPSARVSQQALECLINISAEQSTRPVFAKSNAAKCVSEWQHGGAVRNVELLDVLMSNLKVSS